MSIQQFTLRSICIFAFLCLLVQARAQSPVKAKPNIIIIYADDMGYGDLSSFGGDIPTPNIDKIGKEGIRFTDFYVAAPVCTPSRYGLLTGSYPIRSQHKLQNVLFPGSESYLDKSERTLAEYLKTQDYTTALIGKWHLGYSEQAFPTNHGFDRFIGFTGGCIDYYYHTYAKLGLDWYTQQEQNHEEGYSTDLLTGHAMDFIDENRKADKPFFLFLTYNAPHYGKSDPDSLPENTITIEEAKYKESMVANTLQAPKKYIDKFANVKDPYRRVYSAMVSCLDDNVGRLMARLEKDGLLESTMIWFISDNGGYAETHRKHASNGKLRGEKGSVWEGGIRVPALVSWKGVIKKNQTIHTPVCNVDMVPTVASIIGFKSDLAGKKIDGVDISKVLFKGENLQRNIFWKFNQKNAIRSGDWKLVQGTELYNLKTDISERTDLAAKYPDKVKELQAKYAEVEKTLP